MAESKLREVQSWFWRSIAGEPGEYDFESELVEAIEPSRTQEPAQRLEVYADAYYLRLRDVLAEDFPRVAQLLGDEDFARLARGYLKAHPSTEPSVRHLGRALAEFIRTQENLPPWLADLAALEWARVNAFDAPDDSAPLTTAKLAELDPAIWPQQQLVPVRSLETLTASWPVHRLWAAEGSPGPVEADATSIRVWRGKDFHVFHAPMDARESAGMSSLLAGASFAEICQIFEDLEEQQAAQEAGALLLRWLEDGIIARVE
ncbi:MAG: DUF2063 domain-containing protein [Candidatus Binataceae bacterium]